MDKPQSHKKLNIVRMVLMGLLFAAAIILSLVEDAIHLPMPAPGVKLGLSNIIIMYALFFLGLKDALLLALLKSMFVFITRGHISAIISLSGGLGSVLIMFVLFIIFKDKISYLIISIAGSIFHNLGQLSAVSLIYTNLLFLPYLPVLMVFGVIAGVTTATLLRVVLPALDKLGLR